MMRTFFFEDLVDGRGTHRAGVAHVIFFCVILQPPKRSPHPRDMYRLRQPMAAAWRLASQAGVRRVAAVATARQQPVSTFLPVLRAAATSVHVRTPMATRGIQTFVAARGEEITVNLPGLAESITEGEIGSLEKGMCIPNLCVI